MKDYLAEAKKLVKAAGLSPEHAPGIAEYNRHRDEDEPGQRSPGDLPLEKSTQAGLKILRDHGSEFLRNLS